MSQSEPATREEFKEFCFRQLGHPVIKVNVDDVQAEDNISLAVQFFQEYHYDGVEKTYLKHQVTSGDKANGYVQMSESVSGVSNIFPLSGAASVNMFDLRYQLRLNDLWDLSSTSYVNYSLTMQHLRTLDMIFHGETSVRYNKINNRLYIDWDWQNDVAVGEYIIAEGTVVVDPTANGKFWNDRMLKMLGTALIKRQWGSNLKKHTNIQLLGGVTLNGKELYDEGNAEVENIMNQIKETYQQPPGFLVG